MGFNGIQVAKLAQTTWLTVGLNRGIWLEYSWGETKPTNITRGPHLVGFHTTFFGKTCWVMGASQDWGIPPTFSFHQSEHHINWPRRCYDPLYIYIYIYVLHTYIYTHIISIDNLDDLNKTLPFAPRTSVFFSNFVEHIFQPIEIDLSYVSKALGSAIPNFAPLLYEQVLTILLTIIIYHHY